MTSKTAPSGPSPSGSAPAVLICDTIAELALEKLKKAGFRVDIATGLKEPALVEKIPTYQAVVVRSATKITRPVIAAGKSLKIIARAGVGLDNVDAEAAMEHSIKVVNTPTATSTSVAELALGFMFAAVRRIPQASASVKSGKWDKKSFMGTELANKRVGVIGLGRIGLLVALKCRALGMDVVTTDARYEEILQDLERRVGITLMSLPLGELLPSVDIVSVHVPLIKETANLMNAWAFERMRKGSILINCARGGIVNEKELIPALAEGRPAVYCTDVFEQEPPPADHPFFKMDNVILTPHIAGQTVEAQDRAGMDLSDILIAHFKKA